VHDVPDAEVVPHDIGRHPKTISIPAEANGKSVAITCAAPR